MVCVRRADAGGIQFQVVPLRAESYYDEERGFFLPRTIQQFFTNLFFAPLLCAQLAETDRRHEPWMEKIEVRQAEEPAPEVTARQEIEEDPYQFAEWDQAQTVRSCVHPCDSSVWRQITGTNPPHPALAPKDYKEAGIPWFDEYGEDGKLLPENSPIAPELIVQYGNTRRPGEVQEFLDATDQR